MDMELDKLDQSKSIEWISAPPPKGTKVIPLTCVFDYKRSTAGALLERKAKFALRGDLMRPNIHYSPV